MKEHRRFPRFKTELKASFAAYELHGIKEGVVSNLSRKGAQVGSDSIVDVGKEAAFYIHTSDDPTPIIIDMARVRWVTPLAFGLEFNIVSRSKEKERLNRLLLGLAHDAKWRLFFFPYLAIWNEAEQKRLLEEAEKDEERPDTGM
jgi:hypothetical protein